MSSWSGHPPSNDDARETGPTAKTAPQWGLADDIRLHHTREAYTKATQGALAGTGQAMRRGAFSTAAQVEAERVQRRARYHRQRRGDVHLPRGPRPAPDAPVVLRIPGMPRPESFYRPPPGLLALSLLYHVVERR